MCGNGLIGMAHAQLRSTTATPVATLLAHPGVEIKATAEIRDIYSRPIQPIEVWPRPGARRD